jgi:hypothetical protein
MPVAFGNKGIQTVQLRFTITSIKRIEPVDKLDRVEENKRVYPGNPAPQ